jgi:acyl carrier protein
MDAHQISNWLVGRIAEALRISPGEIDVRAPITDHGLDSISILQLTGALEEMLDRPLPSTLVFEYPTIEILARHLAA